MEIRDGAPTARDEMYMKRAIELLKTCPECEVPVAAIGVCGDEIVVTGVNRRETDSDPTAHA